MIEMVGAREIQQIDAVATPDSDHRFRVGFCSVYDDGSPRHINVVWIENCTSLDEALMEIKLNGAALPYHSRDMKLNWLPEDMRGFRPLMATTKIYTNQFYVIAERMR